MNRSQARKPSWWRSPLFTPLEHLVALLLIATIVFCIARMV